MHGVYTYACVPQQQLVDVQRNGTLSVSRTKVMSQGFESSEHLGSIRWIPQKERDPSRECQVVAESLRMEIVVDDLSY